METFGPTRALKYHEALERTFELIADMPAIGRADEDHPGYHRFFHGRHVIIYRLESDAVVIARLLHVAMDLPRHHIDGEEGD